MATSLDLDLADIVNITARAGDSLSLVINDTNSTDFSSHTVKFEIRKRTSDATVLLALDDSSGITPGNGTITVAATAAQMQLPVGTYDYGVQVNTTNYDVRTILSGTISLTKDTVDT